MSLFETTSAAATMALAEKLMQKWLQLYGADNCFVVLLTGDYGAGKTHFVKGAAKGAGVINEIVSPSYVYIREYSFKYAEKVGNFVHVDAWRLKTEQDLRDIGLEKYIHHGNIILMEWGGLLTQELVNLPNLVKIDVKITEEPNGKRRIAIEERRGWGDKSEILNTKS